MLYCDGLADRPDCALLSPLSWVNTYHPLHPEGE